MMRRLLSDYDHDESSDEPKIPISEAQEAAKRTILATETPELMHMSNMLILPDGQETEQGIIACDPLLTDGPV